MGAAPCIWTFLSSLGEKALTNILHPASQLWDKSAHSVRDDRVLAKRASMESFRRAFLNPP
jgi:hypothetical protein